MSPLYQANVKELLTFPSFEKYVTIITYKIPRASGEIGIHARLKILWPQGREGSSPSSPTKYFLTLTTSI